MTASKSSNTMAGGAKIVVPAKNSVYNSDVCLTMEIIDVCLTMENSDMCFTMENSDVCFTMENCDV